MGAMTKTTAEVQIGEYRYRAELEGNRMDLWRDGVHAGVATWNGGTIEDFPLVLCDDARDELTAEIVHNLGLAWRERVEMPPPDGKPSAAPAPAAELPKVSEEVSAAPPPPEQGAQ